MRERVLWWGVITPMLGLPVLLAMTAVAMVASFLLLYGGKVLPLVSVGGVSLGRLTEAEAAQALRDEWRTITLQNGAQTWPVDADELGITLNVEASAAQAYQQGRGQGGFLNGLASPVDLPPVMTVDAAQARAALSVLAPQFARAPVNAGIRVINGHAEASPPIDGWALDIGATLARLTQNGALAGGTLDLVMSRVTPAIMDSSSLVAEAENLLRTALTFRLYDPVTGDNAYWTVPQVQWGSWLVAVASGVSLSLTVDQGAVQTYLEMQAGAVFDPSRYLRMDEVVATVQAAVAAGNAAGYARVYHRDRQHTVQSDESLISIAWDYGVPYPWIQQANGGASYLAVGQTVTIPSADNFLEYPVVPDKRIVLSISQQHVWVYENGAVKWDWVISTGIADSPTWPGIYQVISHERNAYAGNWDLYMPYFMGVYRPIPGADFTNGFHGFPTRGGSQLLWTNSLGTRVTYGCILLSNQNAELLYNWAEEGVVVEIQA